MVIMPDDGKFSCGSSNIPNGNLGNNRVTFSEEEFIRVKMDLANAMSEADSYRHQFQSLEVEKESLHRDVTRLTEENNNLRAKLDKGGGKSLRSSFKKGRTEGDGRSLSSSFDSGTAISDLMTEKQELKEALDRVTLKHSELAREYEFVVSERDEYKLQIDKENKLDPDEVALLVKQIKTQMKRKLKEAAAERLEIELNSQQIRDRWQEKAITLEAKLEEQAKDKEDAHDVLRRKNAEIMELMNQKNEEMSEVIKRKNAESVEMMAHFQNCVQRSAREKEELIKSIAQLETDLHLANKDLSHMSMNSSSRSFCQGQHKWSSRRTLRSSRRSLTNTKEEVEQHRKQLEKALSDRSFEMIRSHQSQKAPEVQFERDVKLLVPEVQDIPEEEDGPPPVQEVNGGGCYDDVSTRSILTTESAQDEVADADAACMPDIERQTHMECRFSYATLDPDHPTTAGEGEGMSVGAASAPLIIPTAVGRTGEEGANIFRWRRSNSLLMNSGGDNMRKKGINASSRRWGRKNSSSSQDSLPQTSEVGEENQKQNGKISQDEAQAWYASASNLLNSFPEQEESEVQVSLPQSSSAPAVDKQLSSRCISTQSGGGMRGIRSGAVA